MSANETRGEDLAQQHFEEPSMLRAPSDQLNRSTKRQASEATLSPACDVESQHPVTFNRQQSRRLSHKSQRGDNFRDMAFPTVNEYEGEGKDVAPDHCPSGDQSFGPPASIFSGGERTSRPPLRHASTSMSGHAKRDSTVVMEQEKLPRALRISSSDPEKQEGQAQNFYKEAVQRRIKLKNLIIAAGSEFCGTFLFLLFAEAIATTVSNRADILKAQNAQTTTDLEGLLLSSLGFGFSLCISVWTFYRISGGVQNPAITLALTLSGAMDISKCICLSVAQFAGGITASAVVSALLPGKVNARTTLSTGVTVAQGFWIEFFLTANLIFTVLMLAAEKHRGTFLAPVGIGLALFITQLFGQPYTGASCNPARSLGPDIVAGQFNGYTWIYYVAPYCSAVFVWAFYLLLKWLRYETAAEGQDDDGLDAVEKIEVVKDAYGNVIGALELIAKADYQPVMRNDDYDFDDVVALGPMSMDRSNTWDSTLRGEYNMASLKRMSTGKDGRGRSSTLQSITKAPPVPPLPAFSPVRRPSAEPMGINHSMSGSGQIMEQPERQEVIENASPLHAVQGRGASPPSSRMGHATTPSAPHNGNSRIRPESLDTVKAKQQVS